MKSSSSSSPLIVYPFIYSCLLIFAFLLHQIFLPTIHSSLLRIYLIDLILTCILYAIGHYVFSSPNIYDLHWPLIPPVCCLYFQFQTDSFIELSPIKRLPLLCLIFAWSSHLVWQTISQSKDLYHEDWRYEMMRKQYKDKFEFFSFFALHLLPMFEVLIGSSPLFYIYSNAQQYHDMKSFDVISLGMLMFGVLLENIADKQLSGFREYKKRSKDRRFAVLSTGVWSWSRHPNYLGEMTFWWGLFFFGWSHGAPYWCAIGAFLIMLMMTLGSIPMTEERMFRKYPEYKSVQQRVPMLFPTFNLLP